MKKAIEIVLTIFVLFGLLLKFWNVMDVHGKFVIEEEVQIHKGEVIAEPEPVQPIPVAPVEPEILPEQPTETVVEVKEPQSDAEPPDQEEAVEQPSTKEIEQDSETVIEQLTTEDAQEPDSEADTEEKNINESSVEESVSEPDTEMQEPERNTEQLTTEELVPEKQNVEKPINPDLLAKVIGYICICCGLILALHFCYGNVRIYNLSSEGKFILRGYCRSVRGKDKVRIYISKIHLCGKKTATYKVVIHNRLLDAKKIKSVFLVLPGQEKVEVGLRKEIEFEYN